MKNISASTYSFNNILFTEKMPTWDDFFRTLKELGIGGVELVSMNLQDRDPAASSMVPRHG